MFLFIHLKPLDNPSVINDIADRIMRKDEQSATLTQLEIERNKMISKVRYKIEQYFGVMALHQEAGRTRFITLVKGDGISSEIP